MSPLVAIAVSVMLPAVISLLSFVILARARGVQGVRSLSRDLLDLQADVSALERRLNSEQKRRAGDSSALSKAQLSKSTEELLAKSLMNRENRSPDLVGR